MSNILEIKLGHFFLDLFKLFYLNNFYLNMINNGNNCAQNLTGNDG